MDRRSWFANTLAVVALYACAMLLAAGCPGPNAADRPPAQPSPTSANPAGAEGPGRPADPPAAPPAADSPGQPLPRDPNAAAAPPRTAADPGTGNDPAARHEPLFVGWPKPVFALLVTGNQNGYIEPCGCTGLANQKGGMARRHTLLKSLVERGWEVVPVDAGNQVRRYGRQPEIKFQLTVEGLRKLGYRAAAFGPDDLRLTTGEVLAVIGEKPEPFVSANVSVLGVQVPYTVVTAGGKRIGITSVLGSEEQRRITGEEVQITPAAESLARAWLKLKDEKCDLYVLLAHAGLEESRRLAAAVPDFHLVVTTGGGGEPTLEPEKVAAAGTVLVQCGDKGMYAGVVGVYDDPKAPLRYQRIPLDDRFADSREMLDLLASYQDQLKTLGLEGLELRPIPHPSGRKFVGSQTCGDCHTKAFAVWEKTPHHHATDSIAHPTERSEIPRHFDPECLSCHVTGWNPQGFFPYASGYLDLMKSKALHGNGCENCHGPGSAHVAAESGEADADDAVRDMLRRSMRLPLAEARTRCLECHDLDNSPDFHAPGAFEKYWKRIEHRGKD